MWLLAADRCTGTCNSSSSSSFRLLHDPWLPWPAITCPALNSHLPCPWYACRSRMEQRGKAVRMVPAPPDLPPQQLELVLLDIFDLPMLPKGFSIAPAKSFSPIRSSLDLSNLPRSFSSDRSSLDAARSGSASQRPQNQTFRIASFKPG